MNQLNALEGRRRDLYHVDHVSLILYEGMLHRADGGYVSGKNEYEKIIDKNDSKKGRMWTNNRVNFYYVKDLLGIMYTM